MLTCSHLAILTDLCNFQICSSHKKKNVVACFALTWQTRFIKSKLCWVCNWQWFLQNKNRQNRCQKGGESPEDWSTPNKRLALQEHEPKWNQFNRERGINKHILSGCKSILEEKWLAFLMHCNIKPSKNVMRTEVMWTNIQNVHLPSKWNHIFHQCIIRSWTRILASTSVFHNGCVTQVD